VTPRKQKINLEKVRASSVESTPTVSSVPHVMSSLFQRKNPLPDVARELGENHKT
jgi:hypothetical protein